MTGGVLALQLFVYDIKFSIGQYSMYLIKVN